MVILACCSKQRISRQFFSLLAFSVLSYQSGTASPFSAQQKMIPFLHYCNTCRSSCSVAHDDRQVQFYMPCSCIVNLNRCGLIAGLPAFLIHMPPLELLCTAPFSCCHQKLSIIGAIYSFPSLYGVCVMSVSHFLLGASALKSPFKRFSCRSAFLSDLARPSGLLLLLCWRTSLKPCRILEMSCEFEV